RCRSCGGRVTGRARLCHARQDRFRNDDVPDECGGAARARIPGGRPAAVLRAGGAAAPGDRRHGDPLVATARPGRRPGAGLGSGPAGACAGRRRRPLVVAKSLGSFAAPVVAARGLPAIWLTPLLGQETVVAALRAAGPRRCWSAVPPTRCGTVRSPAR